jgi:hypothetical protein
MVDTIPIHLLEDNSIRFIKKGEPTVRPFFVHVFETTICVYLIAHPP